MASRIYCFSGTGNSLKVARDLAAELGDVELVAIPKAIGEPPRPPADRTGLVFPTYCTGLPLIVARFIREKLEPKGYVFAVATSAGMPGGVLKRADEALRAKGGALAAGFHIRMPGNYTCLAGPESLPRRQKFFAREQARVKEIASIIREGRTAPIEGSFLLISVLAGLINRYGFAPRAAGADKSFWSDEKCTHCGLCAKVCPVDNVEIRDGKPVWLHHCEQCYACLQWCPVAAIQDGKHTAKRERYHHPDIKAADIVACKPTGV